MSNYLQKVIYLSQSDYDTLLNGGSVTKSGRTLTGIDSNYIYITDENNISDISGLTNIINQLDSKIMIKTTAEWASISDYIPPKDTIMVYSDRNTLTKDGVTYNVAGIKVADGLAYGIDQPFVGDDIAAQILQQLTTHINDAEKHITNTERSFWNNKINCSDIVLDEALILNRN